ncbi:benzoate transporter [Enterobacter sp. RIT637]|uniref:benzoate transporter n=1 Tax=Enterobacter sp. RIT637 TaxID=2870470 RepID=UPI001C86F349|nr:benzoate transporter [Enterobacter sp. RIT637]MBX8459740.1 benzoate transporter [Enterobacter sp. RIT637]
MRKDKGIPKPLNFNIEKPPEFKDKIISDVDEIFTPEAIKQINPKKLCTTFHMNFFNYQFNLQVFNKDDSPRLCTLPRATTLRNLRDHFGGKPFDFRNVKSTEIYKDFLSRMTFKFRNKIVKNAGWHFSWVMSPERISKKMSTISHTEHDTPEFNNPEHIMRVITNAEDIWGRDRKLAKQVLKKPEFPAYLVDNKEKFKEFII